MEQGRALVLPLLDSKDRGGFSAVMGLAVL